MTREEAIAQMHEFNRHEGDWKTWSPDVRVEGQDTTIVGWMPHRHDWKPVVHLEATTARDAKIIVSVLRTTEARLPDGFEFEKEAVS